MFNPTTGCDEIVRNRRPRDDDADHDSANENGSRGHPGRSATSVRVDLISTPASTAWDARMPTTHSWLYVPLIAAAQGLHHPGQAMLAGLPAYNAAVAALQLNHLVMTLPIPHGQVYYHADQQENVMDAELEVHPTGAVATVIQQAVDQRLAALPDPRSTTASVAEARPPTVTLTGLSATEARNFLWETIYRAIAAGQLTDRRAAVIAPRILAVVNEALQSGTRITRSWIRSLISRSIS